MTLSWPVARVVLAVLLMACGPLCGAGCDSRAAAVKLAMDTLIEANQARDGDKVASMYSGSTVQYYDRLLRLAATARKEEIWKLPLYDREQLIGIRRGLTLAEMKGLDGKAYIKRCVREGHWQVEWGVEDYGAISVNGSTAWMKVKKPDTRTRTSGRWRQLDTRTTYKVRFELEDNTWKLDETSLQDLWNEVMQDDVKELGISEEEYLLADDGEGEAIPKTIWDPPKK